MSNIEVMLQTADYTILVAVVLLPLGIGLYHSRTGGRQRTPEEFILNNRKLKVLPTLLSFVVSYQSAISVLHAPAEYYQWGTPMWLVGDMLTMFTIWLVERLIVPVFYKLRLTSVYEYLELRFQSIIVRRIASILGIVHALIYMAVTVLGASISLETMTNLPFEAAILIMVGCCAVYTALGGMRAVIWTDVIQCIIMALGLVVLLVSAVNVVGGMEEVFDTGRQKGRIFFARFDADPRTRMSFWSLLIGCFPLYMYSYGCNQSALQRYAAMPSLGKARLVMLLLGPCIVMYTTLCYLVGASVFAYFSKIQCDPFQSRMLSSPNQLLPFFVKTCYDKKAGGQGLFLAVLYSASLSSVSSVLSGCAANIWEDHIKPHFSTASDARAALANKVLVVILAAVISTLSVFVAHMPGNLLQILGTLSSSASAPVAGIFFLATLTSHSEWRGAIIGCVVGITVTAWISFGSLRFANPSRPLPPLDIAGCDTYFPNISVTNLNNASTHFLSHLEDHDSSPHGFQHLYTISFMWFPPIGIVTTYIVGLIASKLLCMIFKRKPEVKNDHLIHFRDLFQCDGLCRDTPKNGSQADISTNEVLMMNIKDTEVM